MALSLDQRRYLDEVRRLALREFPGGAQVYLFGSFASGRARRGSDIDVAVLPRAGAAKGALSRLREALEESWVPHRVDVVDLREADPAFRERVLREGVRWSA